MDQSSNGGGVPEGIEDEDQVEVLELEEDPDGMFKGVDFVVFFSFLSCFLFFFL